MRYPDGSGLEAYNGTFILAVCENVASNNCVNVDQGSGTNPMNPYTYTTKLTDGQEGLTGGLAALADWPTVTRLRAAA